MRSCAVYRCANRSSKKIPGITFHSFPKDNERQKMWIRAIGRENWSPSRHSTVCSDHFPESEFDRTSLCVVRLREWAIPSLSIAFPSCLPRKSKVMEEPCFIKCEPEWQLDSEETSTLESNASLIPSQLAATTIKIEERDLRIKEEGADECKEVVKTEVCDDDCDTDENPVDNVESLSSSTSAEVAESIANEKKECEENCVEYKKTYTCCMCGKVFRERRNLCSHMLVHCDSKHLTCFVCQKSFRYQCNLANHLIVHSGDRAFICSTCGMSFNFKFHLTKHQLVHTKVRGFSCSTCGKEFSRRSSVSRHALLHQGSVPQVCTMCGRSFTVRSSLLRHLKVHSKERRHSCVASGKTYSQKSHLKQHLQKSSTCVSS